MEAATSTAASKASGVHSSGRVSRATVARGRLVSTCSRTMSVPVRAVDAQCTWRRSSPGSYSRSDEKVMVPRGADSDRGPSKSATTPAGSGERGWVRGWTHRTSAPPAGCDQRRRANGSVRTVVTGPISNRPRTLVSRAWWTRRSSPGPMAGAGTVTGLPPTRSVTSRAGVDRRPTFSTVRMATAGSPAVSRGGTSWRDTATRGRPAMKARATTGAAAHATPSWHSSGQSRTTPAVKSNTAAARAATPWPVRA